MGVGDQRWINGLYEAACIIVLFPLIVAIGAGGEKDADGPSVRIAALLRRPLLSALPSPTLSTLICAYTGWVVDGKPTPALGTALAGWRWPARRRRRDRLGLPQAL
ncbi:hypothetical protein ACRAWD_17300 [Caulobacter segnis]